MKSENLEVTDDVSVIEALGKPVKLTLGEYTNIKLTTPDDLAVAEQVLRDRGVLPPPPPPTLVQENDIKEPVKFGLSSPPTAVAGRVVSDANKQADNKKKFIGF